MVNSQNYDKSSLLKSIFVFQKQKFVLFPLSFLPALTNGFTNLSDGYKYAFNLTDLENIISAFTGSSLIFTWNGISNVTVSDGYTSQTLVIYAGSNPVTS